MSPFFCGLWERAMKYSVALAHIRQLCCLGLGGEAIMSAVLRDLHDLVPCDSAGFFWVDEHYAMSNLTADQTSRSTQRPAVCASHGLNLPLTATCHDAAMMEA
jgi:hypothetical protein